MADETGRGDALDTLGQIAEGGEKLVAMAQSKLRETMLALAEGRFDYADDRLREAGAMVDFLATAERTLRDWPSGVELVPAGDVDVGAVLSGYGDITAVEEVSGQYGRPSLRIEYEKPTGEPGVTVVPADAPVSIEVRP